MSGGCGTGAVHYVLGDLIHKDSCLSADDRATHFCPCVSRAQDVLVLPFRGSHPESAGTAISSAKPQSTTQLR